MITGVNSGDASTDGSPIQITDALPAGIVAKAVSGEDVGNGRALSCKSTPAPSCSYEGFEVAPGDVLTMSISVSVTAGAASGTANMVTIAGGGASKSSHAEDPTTISSTLASTGVWNFATSASGTQAGAPTTATVGFGLSRVIDEAGAIQPAFSAKDVDVKLPPGLLLDATAVPACTWTDVYGDACPYSTAVGVVFTQLSHNASSPPVWSSSIVHKAVPSSDEPAAFAFEVSGTVVRLDLSMRPEDGYAAALHMSDLPAGAGIVSMIATLWNVPARFQNGQAGPDRVSSGVYFGDPYGAVPEKAFVVNPGNCSEAAPISSLRLSSWIESEAFVEASSEGLSLDGCQLLGFSPSLGVTPDAHLPNVPSGASIEIGIPQTSSPNLLAGGELRSAVVTLPSGEGLALPFTWDRLACTEAEVSLHSAQHPQCPEASIVGFAKLRSPLLEAPLLGHVFLAEPEANPYGALMGVYVVAEGSGVAIKLAGELHLDQATGQVSVVFDELPQLPFGTLELHFQGGPRALLDNPATCGEMSSTSELVSWDGGASAAPGSSFDVEGCSATTFGPSLEILTTRASDGGYGAITFFAERADSEAELSGFTLRFPGSVQTAVAKAEPCEGVHAEAGTCGIGSYVGSIALAAGVGSHPVLFAGPLYLTGPYDGAPLGLEMVLALETGPLDLGTLVIRGALGAAAQGEASARFVSLPSLVRGVPLKIGMLALSLEAGPFDICEEGIVTGEFASAEGATAASSAILPPAGCTPTKAGSSSAVPTSSVSSVPSAGTHANSRASDARSRRHRCRVGSRKKHARRVPKCAKRKTRFLGHRRRHRAHTRHRARVRRRKSTGR